MTFLQIKSSEVKKSLFTWVYKYEQLNLSQIND